MLPPKSYAKGFTLIELLSTVLIIAVLAALVYPAIRGTIGKANQAKCANNLRVLGGGIQAYTAENDGRLPFGKDERFRPLLPSWSSGEYIGRYVGCPDSGAGSMIARGKVFICPSQPVKSASGVDEQNAGSYMANIYLMPIRYTDADEAVRLASVVYPARTVLLSEGYTASLAWKMDTWSQFVNNGFGGRLRHGPHPPTDVSKSKKGDAMNILFVDGHVEMWALPRDPQPSDYMLFPRASVNPLMGPNTYALPRGDP